MKSYFDQIAPDYARHRRVHPEVLRELIVTGPIQPNTRVLEIGCGTGNYIHALRESVGCPCWGIDPAEQMLAQAAPRSETVQFTRGRAEQLDFPAESFDMTFAVDVVHHLSNRKLAFREAWRVLRPGGRVCLVTESEEMLRSRQPQAVYFPETVAAELARYPSMDSLWTELLGAGFDHLTENSVEFTTTLTDLEVYRTQAYSSLRAIPKEAYDRGMARLEHDFLAGPIPWVSRYHMLWGTKLDDSNRVA